MVKIGDKIKIVSDNENYDRFRNKIWFVTHIASDRTDHPGYDEGMYPEKLVDCKGLPFSLYEYEFIIIK
jgi:hypothetical protein